jgi:hypothetical protein
LPCYPIFHIDIAFRLDISKVAPLMARTQPAWAAKASFKTSSTPGLVQFNATGRNGGYAVAPAAIPVRVTVAVDSAAGQCGEAPFAGPPPSPSCTFGASALSCKA